MDNIKLKYYVKYDIIETYGRLCMFLLCNLLVRSDYKPILYFMKEVLNMVHLEQLIQKIQKMTQEDKNRLLKNVDGDETLTSIAVLMGADINSDILQSAIQSGQVELVRVLVEAGADISAFSYSAVQMAAKCGYTSIIKLFIEADSSNSAVIKNIALSLAAEGGHIDTVKFLIEEGADVNATIKNIATPLSKAAQQGHTEIVKLLIEKGADLTSVNRYLDSMMSLGMDSTIKILIEAGLDPNKAICGAAIYGSDEILKLLIEVGADPNEAMRMCENLGYHNAAERLIALGADSSLIG